MRADERHWHLWKVEDSVRADRLPKPFMSAKKAGKARKRAKARGARGRDVFTRVCTEACIYTGLAQREG